MPFVFPDSSPLHSPLLVGFDPSQRLIICRSKILLRNRRKPQHGQYGLQQLSGCGACQPCKGECMTVRGGRHEVADVGAFFKGISQVLPVDFLLLPLADHQCDVPQLLSAAICEDAAPLQKGALCTSPVGSDHVDALKGSSSARRVESGDECEWQLASAALDRSRDWLNQGGSNAFCCFLPAGGSDLLLRCAEWGSSVIGCASDWVDPDCNGVNEVSVLSARLRRVHAFLARWRRLRVEKRIRELEACSNSDGKGKMISQLQQRRVSLEELEKNQFSDEELRQRTRTLFRDSMTAASLLQESDEIREEKYGGNEEGLLRCLSAAVVASPFLSSGFHIRRLNSEISYASHLNLQAVLLPPPKSAQPIHLARIVKTWMAETQPPSLWVRLPLTHDSDAREECTGHFIAEDEVVAAYSMAAACAASVLEELTTATLGETNELKLHIAYGVPSGSSTVEPSHLYSNDATDSSPSDLLNAGCKSRLDSWQQWRFLQQVVGVSASFGVALEMTADLPSEFVLQRWLAEPLRCILIPTSIFMQDPNEALAVKLSDKHLGFLLRCVELNVRIVLVDTKDDRADVGIFGDANEVEFPTLVSSAGNRQRGKKTGGSDKTQCMYSSMLPYFEYLQRAFMRLPSLPAFLLFSKNYRNILQMPMQPLADDLSACSYEVFERDATKYRVYRDAIVVRLRELLGIRSQNRMQLRKALSTGKRGRVHKSRTRSMHNSDGEMGSISRSSSGASDDGRSEQEVQGTERDVFSFPTLWDNPNCMYSSPSNIPHLLSSSKQHALRNGSVGFCPTLGGDMAEEESEWASSLFLQQGYFQQDKGRFRCLSYVSEVKFDSEDDYYDYTPPESRRRELGDIAAQMHNVDKACSGVAFTSEAPSFPRVVIYVVGAGRGPLVQAALDALRFVGLPPCFFKLAAVEKNPQALFALLDRQAHDACKGWRYVQVVRGDMRSTEVAEQFGGLRADILVSELLGSLGDNELSPECIDGAQQLLLRRGGISIPAYYWSSLEPVSAPLLHAAAGVAYPDMQQLDGMFVVNPHGVFRPSSEGPRKCFFFLHPNPLLPPLPCTETASRVHAFTKTTVCGRSRGEALLRGADGIHEADRKLLLAANGLDFSCWTGTYGSAAAAATSERLFDRHAVLSWRMRGDCLVHGFLGYFHCCLYGDVTLSIDPRTHTAQMVSWFPMLLLLRQPIFVGRDQRLTLAISRKSSGSRVWIERAVIEPNALAIQNINGFCCAMGK